MKPCPCDSGKHYLSCCGQYIDSNQSPTTPEQLMRSRYSAYTQAKIDYIQKTMRGKAAQGFDPISAHAWASEVNWLGLTVIRTFQESPSKGFVEFVARYSANNQNAFIHELSEFERLNEHWYYVDGVAQPKPKRNQSCLCGSGKKFKHCCGA